GQKTDIGEGAIFRSPPSGDIQLVRFYASYRDRFDDPDKPRIVGGWKVIKEQQMPGLNDHFDVRLEAGVPFVIAGFDKDGKVTKWTTAAKDSSGKHGAFYAFAGDHYSAVKAGRYDFCAGCHAGHSNPNFDASHH